MISVVVPVYKVEKYLRQCVDSVLRQTYQDFELILVDDGSPDRCGEICDQYAAQDSRVKVVHQANGGYSAARNAGIDLATGEYLMFVDSDDYVHEEMLETLHRSLIESEAELVVCCYHRVDVEGTPVDFSENDPVNEEMADGVFSGIISGREALRRMPILPAVWIVPWGKLYKRELFASIRFPLHKLHEDNWVSFQVIFSCSKIQMISNRLYYYRENPDGVTKLGATFEKSLCHIEALIDRMSFYENNDLNDVVRQLICHLLRCYFSLRGNFPAPQSAADVKRIRLVKRNVRRIIHKYGEFFTFKDIVFFEFPSVFNLLKRKKSTVDSK